MVVVVVVEVDESVGGAREGVYDGVDVGVSEYTVLEE